MTDQNDSVARQEFEKRTNVRIEWKHPTIGQEAAQFNLMVASQDYPDSCAGITNYLIGGWDKYIDMGFVMDLTPYTKYMQNYMERRKVSDTTLRNTITDAGRIAYFQEIKKTIQPPFMGPMVRKEMLAEINAEIPMTYDDWHAMLTAFKDQLGIKIPMTMYDGTGMDGFLMNGFGLSGNMAWGSLFYQDNGTVHYSPYDAAFKDYLTMMNKWYNEGLIDNSFVTRTYQDNEPMLLSGEAGCSDSIFGLNLDRYNIQTEGENVEWYPVEVPKLTADATRSLWAGAVSTYDCNSAINLTTECTEEKIPVILQYFDYMYTDEGSLLYNYGIEGETFEYGEDGKPHYMDFVTNNSSGLSLFACMTKYSIQGGGAAWYEWEREISPSISKTAFPLAGQVWGASIKDPQVLPRLGMADEIIDEYTSKYTDLVTYVEQMAVRFISGDESLSDYDKFISEMEKLGVKDIIQWQQDAYNLYLARDIKVGY